MRRLFLSFKDVPIFHHLIQPIRMQRKLKVPEIVPISFLILCIFIKNIFISFARFFVRSVEPFCDVPFSDYFKETACRNLDYTIEMRPRCNHIEQIFVRIEYILPIEKFTRVVNQFTNIKYLTKEWFGSVPVEIRWYDRVKVAFFKPKWVFLLHLISNQDNHQNVSAVQYGQAVQVLVSDLWRGEGRVKCVEGDLGPYLVHEAISLSAVVSEFIQYFTVYLVEVGTSFSAGEHPRNTFDKTNFAKPFPPVGQSANGEGLRGIGTNLLDSFGRQICALCDEFVEERHGGTPVGLFRMKCLCQHHLAGFSRGAQAYLAFCVFQRSVVEADILDVKLLYLSISDKESACIAGKFWCDGKPSTHHGRVI